MYCSVAVGTPKCVRVEHVFSLAASSFPALLNKGSAFQVATGPEWTGAQREIQTTPLPISLGVCGRVVDTRVFTGGTWIVGLNNGTPRRLA